MNLQDIPITQREAMVETMVEMATGKLVMTTERTIAMVTPAQPSECSCGECRAMCEHCPCIGTPQDIWRIIEAGHVGKLSDFDWAAGASIGIPPIMMIQPSYAGEQDEVGIVDEKRKYPCVFYKDGRCSIHAIKPTEGRLASCKGKETLSNSPVLAVALTWTLPANAEIIAKILTAYVNHRKKTHHDEEEN